MGQSNSNTNRLADGCTDFRGGVDSLNDPEGLQPNESSWAINMINRGGVWRLRDGFHSIVRLPDGKAQGMTIFTPTGGTPSIVAAVSGRIWTSTYPFTVWTQLPNIIFSTSAEHVVFKETTQLVDAGTRIPPRNLLIMQDGVSKAAYWDGSTNRHLNPGGATMETPQGLWMEFIGARLWLSRGAEIFASDIYDPLHFTETQYLTGGGSLLTIDGKPVSGMARTADDKSLLAFSNENTTIIAASITDRSLWQSTPNFISILFPGVGCVGGKSITYSNGELFWFSKEGGRRFTQVGATIQVSKNSVASLELERSFINLSPILDRASAFGFNGYVGFSVPSGDVYNRHTWVIDMNNATSSNSAAAPVWQGIWMGTRPVEWATAIINGENRCFHLSQDVVGGVHIWEAFQEDQMDDRGRIFWALETRGMVFNEPMSFKKFLYSEFHAIKIRGQVDLTVEVKSEYTCWMNIMSVTLCAQDCNQLECSDQNQAAVAQARFLRTSENQLKCSNNIGPFSDGIGTSFQNRIRGYGRFGLNKFRSAANQWEEKAAGDCEKGDVDSNGELVCKPLLCCDEEVNYLSISDLNPYGSGSTQIVVGSM